MLSMIAVPAIPTLRTVQRSAFVDVSGQHASPYGYTVSLLLFLVPFDDGIMVDSSGRYTLL